MNTSKLNALTIAIQKFFQSTITNNMKQSFNINTSIDFLPITQPEYDTQTTATATKNAQFCNTNSTTNAPTNTLNNIKRKNTLISTSNNNTEYDTHASKYIQSK